MAAPPSGFSAYLATKKDQKTGAAGAVKARRKKAAKKSMSPKAAAKP